MPNDEMLRKAASALQKAVDEKNRKRLESDRKEMIAGLGGDIVQMMKPALSQMVRDNSEALNQAISEIKNVQMPDVVIPDIKVPEPRVDVSVDLSSLKIPTPQVSVSPVVKLPDFPKEMDVKGWINMMGYGQELLSNPLPVQLRDSSGKPVNLVENLNAVINGGGGRGIIKISGIEQSAFGMLNPDGRLKVELPSGSSGLTDTELRAAHLDVQQLSGAVDSVYVTGIFGTTFVGSEFVNSDNRLRVSVETGGSGLTDAELRAAHLDVQQVSGSIDSVKVTGFDSSVSVSILNGDGTTLDPRDRNWTITETVPVSGTFWQATQPVSGTVTVSDITNSVKSALIDSSGVQYSGSNPVPITWVSGAGPGTTGAAIVDSTGVQYEGSNPFPITIVTSQTASVNASLVDSGGVGYSGANPVPVTDGSTAAAVLSDTLSNPTTKLYGSATLGFDGTNWERIRTGTGYSDGALRIVHATDVVTSVYVTGSSGTTVIVGPTVADTADDGNAPVQFGGIARQANPTAVAANDIVKATFDDLGRQVMRPVQVRDLIGTAYTTLTSGSGYGTETALYAGASGEFHDLIYIMASNSSSASQGLDIRGSTGGTVIMHLEIPGNSVAGVSLPVPLRAHETAQSWTIDASDVTGGNLYVSALFSIEA